MPLNIRCQNLVLSVIDCFKIYQNCLLKILAFRQIEKYEYRLDFFSKLHNSCTVVYNIYLQCVHPHLTYYNVLKGINLFNCSLKYLLSI